MCVCVLVRTEQSSRSAPSGRAYECKLLTNTSNCAMGEMKPLAGVHIMPSWAGLWDNVFAQPYALLNEPSSAARDVARTFFPTAQRDIGAIANALNGVAPGANATATQSYVTAVQADGLNQGGARPVGAVTLINRATTAADVVQLNRVYQPIFAPTVYPVDKSGNGGGSKAGTIN